MILVKFLAFLLLSQLVMSEAPKPSVCDACKGKMQDLKDAFEISGFMGTIAKYITPWCQLMSDIWLTLCPTGIQSILGTLGSTLANLIDIDEACKPFCGKK